MLEVLDILSQPFMLRALAAAVMASALSAVVGTFAVLRGMSTVGAAMAHTSLAGALLTFLAGADPLLGATVLSLALALAIGYGGVKGREAERLLGVIFGLSSSLAALALSLTRRYAAAAYAFLLGDVLGVLPEDLIILGGYVALSLAMVAAFYKEFKFLVFDPEAAEAMGVRVSVYNYALVLLVALTTVVELRIVGSILAVVLLVAPAAAALQFSHSIESMIALSVLISIGSSVAGLLLSALLNLPTSPTVGMIASALYLASLIASPKRRCCRV